MCTVFFGCRFLVVNVEKERAAFSIFPDKSNDVLTPKHKLDLLRTFYRNTVGSVFPLNKNTAPTFTSPAHPEAKGHLLYKCMNIQNQILFNFYYLIDN